MKVTTATLLFLAGTAVADLCPLAATLIARQTSCCTASAAGTITGDCRFVSMSQSATLAQWRQECQINDAWTYCCITILNGLGIGCERISTVVPRATRRLE
ncbi:hypothetical protein B0T14DRAFT_521895 [Immersiella caudata]|uniref:Uncharacterized protein n=1 Tax=Immersiella caudata TaxID=314043 RepID=A0AA40C122_9PEZI|nr:hypothetical protein B0T14DRAFT_521895 [Immersiella caudata]